VTLTGEGERRGVRAVLLLVGLTGVLGAVWALLPRMLSVAGGPEPELVALLRAAELTRAPITLTGSPPFVPRSLRYERLSASIRGDRAWVISTLDAAGSSGGVAVSSLGREQVRFLRRDGRWEVDGPLAPALAGALDALWQRARALDAGSPEALGPLLTPADRDRSLADARLQAVLGTPGQRWEPRAWYLRSERGEVLVTEDAVLHRPARPEEPRTGRLRLVPSEAAGRFVFAGAVL
jgi:hypothetical protein